MKSSVQNVEMLINLIKIVCDLFLSWFSFSEVAWLLCPL